MRILCPALGQLESWSHAGVRNASLSKPLLPVVFARRYPSTQPETTISVVTAGALRELNRKPDPGPYTPPFRRTNNIDGHEGRAVKVERLA